MESQLEQFPRVVDDTTEFMGTGDASVITGKTPSATPDSQSAPQRGPFYFLNIGMQRSTALLATVQSGVTDVFGGIRGSLYPNTETPSDALTGERATPGKTATPILLMTALVLVGALFVFRRGGSK